VQKKTHTQTPTPERILRLIRTTALDLNTMRASLVQLLDPLQADSLYTGCQEKAHLGCPPDGLIEQQSEVLGGN
jgi:hypothetical protein